MLISFRVDWFDLPEVQGTLFSSTTQGTNSSVHCFLYGPTLTSVLSRFSCVQLFATPWTAACQASLSMGFSRQEYWSGLPCPSPGDIPNPGNEPVTLKSALAGRIFITSATWEPQLSHQYRTTGKTIALTTRNLISKVISLLFKHCLGLS